jgi:hypothetical protein
MISVSLKHVFICSFCLVFSTNSFHSQVTSLDGKNIENFIDKGIHYLQSAQYQATDSLNFHFRGEWIATMELENNFVLLGGKAKKHEDSNCFTVGTIHNTLARIYLTDSSKKEILEMLDLSFQRIISYKNNQHYNFWNLLPPQMQLNKFRPANAQKPVRRPTHFPLTNRFVNKAANILEDADDTSIGYTAEYYHSILHPSDSTLLKSEEIAPIFDRYRDVQRTNQHWYNHSRGFDKNTGAFLTWFGEEYHFRNWNIFKDMFHNLFHFLPFTQAFPYLEKPYMPFGSNDLDAVVNANILQLLSLLEQQSKGSKSSIAYIERKVLKGKFDYAAAYYPNRYSVGYAVSQAYKSGEKGLQKSMDACEQFIRENQNADGSWNSRKSINHGDCIQSTVYAVSTLLQADSKTVKQHQCEIERGIQFLLSNAIIENDQIHWKGGVFFSGGTVVRKSLFWKSDALTTAMIVELLVNWQKINFSETNGKSAHD